MHAMLCYRTPDSFEQRFEGSMSKGSKLFNIESWLIHHGEKLQKRFQLSSYKLMNQLLKTIDITSNAKNILNLLISIEAEIHIISIESDLFFVNKKNKKIINFAQKEKHNLYYHQIRSIHGHDAFLIEYDQLGSILGSIF
jgi:homoserine O-acetyltransferase